MILSHVKTEDENIPGLIILKGGLDAPYLVVKNEFDETKIGSYAPPFDLLSYQNMEENKVLTKSFLDLWWNSSKIGHSQFKLDEGLYFNVTPLGGTRYDRTSFSLLNESFPLTSNEVPLDILDELTSWIESNGYQISTSDILTDVVQVNAIVDGVPVHPWITYKTKVITPLQDSAVDSIKVSEGVLNLWKSIDNDRFMKILPTNTNLGSHVILTQFKELTSSSDLTHGLTYYKEIKLRVKYGLLGLDGNPLGTYITSHDMLVNDYNESKVIINNDLPNKFIQVIGSNVAETGQEPIYVVKLIWDKRHVHSAIITDLVTYDNGLIQ